MFIYCDKNGLVEKKFMSEKRTCTSPPPKTPLIRSQSSAYECIGLLSMQNHLQLLERASLMYVFGIGTYLN